MPDVLDEERSSSAAFYPLPFHYIEIAHLLFQYCRDGFGPDFEEVSLSLFFLHGLNTSRQFHERLRWSRCKVVLWENCQTADLAPVYGMFVI
jgi:hypothetical protein